MVAFTVARWKKNVTGEAPTNKEQVLQGLSPLSSHTSPYSIMFTLVEEIIMEASVHLILLRHLAFDQMLVRTEFEIANQTGIAQS